MFRKVLEWQLVKASPVAAIAMSILASATTSNAESPKVLPPDDEIRKILVERVGGNENDVGIIVGVIEPRGRRIISFGHRNTGDQRPLDGDTVFEIGSVTKAFTALLLVDMVEKNEVALSDPVAKYLPADLKVTRTKWPFDHACRSCHAYIGFAVHAGECATAQ